MKVKVKLDNTGFEVEIEDNEQNQDYFELILKKIEDLMTNNQKLISSFISAPKNNNIAIEKTNKEQNLEIRKPITQQKTQKVHNNDSLGITEGMDEKLVKLSQELKINAQKLKLIYDFDSNKYKDNTFTTPPLMPNILSNKKRTENQRDGMLLIFLYHSLINDKKSLFSKAIAPILNDSKINSTDLFNVKKNPEFQKYFKSDTSSYRILHPGILCAKKLISKILSQ